MLTLNSNCPEGLHGSIPPTRKLLEISFQLYFSLCPDQNLQGTVSLSVRILPGACYKCYQNMQILPKKHISLFWTGAIPIVEEQVLLPLPRTVPAAYFLTPWKIFITAGTPCIPANTFQLCWLSCIHTHQNKVHPNPGNAKGVHLLQNVRFKVKKKKIKDFFSQTRQDHNIVHLQSFSQLTKASQPYFQPQPTYVFHQR